MKDVSSLDAIECIAGLVLQLLRCPCGTPEHAVEATVSVGIAMSDGQEPCTFDALYDNACAALFDAKRAKDHRFVIYDCNGKPARGKYGFNRLVNASTPNYQPFLETLANGGVLLRAEPKGPFVPLYFSDSFLALLGGMASSTPTRKLACATFMIPSSRAKNTEACWCCAAACTTVFCTGRASRK